MQRRGRRAALPRRRVVSKEALYFRSKERLCLETGGRLVNLSSLPLHSRETHVSGTEWKPTVACRYPKHVCSLFALRRERPGAANDWRFGIPSDHGHCSRNYKSNDGPTRAEMCSRAGGRVKYRGSPGEFGKCIFSLWNRCDFDDLRRDGRCKKKRD